jgi:hypothetical protein
MVHAQHERKGSHVEVKWVAHGDRVLCKLDGCWDWQCKLSVLPSGRAGALRHNGSRVREQ